MKLLWVCLLLSIAAGGHFEKSKESSEKKLEGPQNNSTKCEDDHPVRVCDEALRANCDEGNLLTRNCRRSCHLCTVDASQREWTSEEERASKCKDMIPECNVYANPAVCCAVKPLANATCQRSCRFCYDMNSIPVVSGLVPIPTGSHSPTGDSPVVYQDPCNPTAPPSAGGVPGGNAVPGGAISGGSGSNGVPGGSSVPGGLPGGNNNGGGSLPSTPVG